MDTAKDKQIIELKKRLVKALLQKNKQQAKELRKQIEELNPEKWFIDEETGEKLFPVYDGWFLDAMTSYDDDPE